MKLVAEMGVGTVAAGVAKAHSDVVLISGHDGGTGASPLTSLKHAGIPWELGLAETQQTLVLNKLRDRIIVQTDGQLKTGRDVVIAALLGAEEFGFATAPLVVMGCIMMRVCHLDTCPVGIATQNPKLREKFPRQGRARRQLLPVHRPGSARADGAARLPHDRRPDRPQRPARHAQGHRPLQGQGARLQQDLLPAGRRAGRGRPQDQGAGPRDRTVAGLDDARCPPAGRPSSGASRSTLDLPIRNVNRTVGTILGSELTRTYGCAGLPDDTIQLQFNGSAGQSFGAFLPRGITLTLEGDANDYVGKGLSGGKIIVFPPRSARFVAEDNVLIGNVALYGATGGQAFFRGRAGERFCVRNSGAQAVVEGTGDHGCEYMTGGVAVVIGPTGRNFAAGMSGGVRIRARRGARLRPALQPRDGRPRAAGRAGGHRAGPRPVDPARRLHRQRGGGAAAQ